MLWAKGGWIGGGGQPCHWVFIIHSDIMTLLLLFASCVSRSLFLVFSSWEIFLWIHFTNFIGASKYGAVSQVAGWWWGGVIIASIISSPRVLWALWCHYWTVHSQMKRWAPPTLVLNQTRGLCHSLVLFLAGRLPLALLAGCYASSAGRKQTAAEMSLDVSALLSCASPESSSLGINYYFSKAMIMR